MPENDPKEALISISFRLMRTTTEAGYVSVPVTPDLLIRHPDGGRRIDVDKITQRSIELCLSTDVDWKVEEQRVEVHPIQAPPDSDD